MNWTWIVTLLALIGTVANIKKRQWCFAIWLFTNAIWCIIDLRAGLYSQAFLFAIYFVLSIWGLCEWKDKKGIGKVRA